MTKPPERIFARKYPRGSADHYGSWYIINEYLMPWNEGGAEEYVNADALRADPLAFIDVPELVWTRKRLHDDYTGGRFHWKTLVAVNGFFQIDTRNNKIVLRNPIGDILGKFANNVDGLKQAKAAANTHYRAMLARALKGEV